MKVVILAGGFGSRLSEETGIRPKPLVEVGGRPIIWHIMKYYSSFGFDEFVILCGYKGEMIKKYFVDYFALNYDLSIDLARNEVECLGTASEKWKILLLDTGEHSMTGGRILRAREHLTETFMLTYGDGISDVPIDQLISTHKESGRLCTVTTVPSPGRFGVLEVGDKGKVDKFVEKPENEGGYINGGFFVVEPSALDLIAGDSTSWEREPMLRLVEMNQLQSYAHGGFWKAMDTLRDKRELDSIWESGDVPWKRWK